MPNSLIVMYVQSIMVTLNQAETSNQGKRITVWTKEGNGQNADKMRIELIMADVLNPPAR